MNTNTKQFLIIDGNALVHRAFHAIPANLYTKNQELVNAVYGFSAMLLNVINKIKPEYVVCTFDMAGPVFRHELYSGYKEHRKKMDDDLANQLEKIRDIVHSFNMPIFEVPRYEADDVIGSLIKYVKEFAKEKNENIRIVILSGDRDILQLIDNDVEVILPGKTFSDLVVYDRNKFFEKYGFEPENLTDYKGLYGDKSDNIPGVPQVGEKSAQNLIIEFQNIEAVYSHLPEIKSALSKKLEGHEDIAILSKKLASIDKTLKLDIDFDRAVFKNFTKTDVQRKFLEFEFKSLLAKIPEPVKLGENEAGSGFDSLGKTNEIKNDTHYVIVRNSAEFRELIDEIVQNNVFSMDTETTSLDQMSAEVVGISIGFSGKRAYYIPMKNGRVNYDEFEENTHKEGLNLLWEEFLNILKDGSYKKIGHNIKYDLHALANSSIKVNGVIFDTMLAAYMLNLPEIDLKNLAFVHEGVEMHTFSELTGGLKLDIRDIDVEEVGMYSSADADLTFRLFERFSKTLETNEYSKLKSLFYNIEMPLLEVLFDMERKGIKLDVGYLAKLNTLLNADISTHQASIYTIVGHEFNINSPKQLSEVIFNELQLPKGRKTKTGYSTDERYFTSIGNVHPIIEPIRLYKELVKLRSTYVSTLPNLVAKDGRIHTSFNQTIASTGRLSSTNPNLQNIPVKTKIGNEIRNAFVADENSCFISFDYSQIELRILAHMSGDKSLIKAFREGIDVHLQTARILFNKDDISYNERRIAKTVNFAIIYGISSFGLSGQLGVSRLEAQRFIDTYFSVYKGVDGYIKKQKLDIEKKGYVESLLGRRRLFKGLENAGNIARNAMLREAINMPIQASNADIIKIAMNEVVNMIASKKYPAFMILQVHDELIFEYQFKNKEAEQPIFETFCRDVKNIMEESYPLDVPVKVDVAVGDRWGSMEDIEIK